jgi:hypothetical protein
MAKLDLKKSLRFIRAYVQRNFSVGVSVTQCWKAMIVVWLALLLATFLLGGYIFWSFERDLSRPVEVGSGAAIETVQKDRLEEALLEINKKEDLYKKALSEKPAVSDPSR